MSAKPTRTRKPPGLLSALSIILLVGGVVLGPALNQPGPEASGFPSGAAIFWLGFVLGLVDHIGRGDPPKLTWHG